jgi:magnesium chelatase family protein
VDIQVHVPSLPSAELLATEPAGGLDHAGACAAVARARERQQERQGCLNADLPGNTLVADLTPPVRALLTRAADRLQLSARSMHKILRLTRTIADLQGSATVQAEALNEALGYRNLDWEGGLGCTPQ